MGSVVAQSQARDLLKALADPLRLQIIESLSSGEKCVCDLIQEIGLAQSKISRQSGRWVYYKLDIGALNELQLWLKQLTQDCQKSSASCENNALHPQTEQKVIEEPQTKQLGFRGYLKTLLSGETADNRKP